MKPTTLADVAALCGVSTMTVSRVVRGVRNVDAKTKERVLAAIEELGYRPNPFSRALASNRMKVAESSKSLRATVAFLDSDPTNYGKQMFDWLAKEGYSLGYTLKYYAFPAKLEEQQRLSHRLYWQGTRGVILGPSQNEVDFSGLDMNLFAVISIGALHHAPAIDSVSQDYFQSMYLAATKCYNSGCKNIGFLITMQSEVRTEHRWLGAYLAFCSARRVTPRIYEYDAFKRPVTERVLEWINKYELDAVVTLYGCVSQCGLLGQKINARIALLSDLVVPEGYGYISIPMELIARESIRLLNQQLVLQEYGTPQWPRQISIQGQWYEKIKADD